MDHGKRTENKLWKTIDKKRLFSYNNRNRISETKRLEYVKLIDNCKKIIIDDEIIKKKKQNYVNIMLKQ